MQSPATYPVKSAASVLKRVAHGLPIWLDAAAAVSPRQAIARLLRRMRFGGLYPITGAWLFPLRVVPAGAERAPIRCFSETSCAHARPGDGLLDRANSLAGGNFALLNQPRYSISSPSGWAPGGYDPLWLYTLHYGEWALDLAHAYLVTQEVRYRDALIALLTGWLDHNLAASRPGWEPYPTSRRLVAWSRLEMALHADPVWQRFWQHTLAPSLHQQARVLAANLEHDLPNNHLIANYRALAWCGLLFPEWPEADRWRCRGLDGMWTQVQRQVLADGVHVERSISYHTAVLMDLLETWWLARHTGCPMPEGAALTLVKMLEFLAACITPDGSWPMVNDTVPGYPLDPREVVAAGAALFNRPDWLAGIDQPRPAYVAWLDPEGIAQAALDSARGPVSVFPEAGYAVLRGGAGGYLFFDAGAMGPHQVPGHGHADALSFVLYGQGGRPLVVDPGVYTYHDREWRNAFRSTAAHNTVAVDGQDQCVFWGPFRAAFLPEARLLAWSEREVAGEHTGYGRLRSPVVHRRKITMQDGQDWTVLDQFTGRGEHDFRLTLQLAPGAEAHVQGLGAAARWPDGTALTVTCEAHLLGAAASIEPGWVSPDWGVRQQAQRYVLQWRSTVPAQTMLRISIGK